MRVMTVMHGEEAGISWILDIFALLCQNVLEALRISKLPYELDILFLATE